MNKAVVIFKWAIGLLVFGSALGGWQQVSQAAPDSVYTDINWIRTVPAPASSGDYRAAVEDTEQGEVVTVQDGLGQAIFQVGVGRFFAWQPNNTRFLFAQDQGSQNGLGLVDVTDQSWHPLLPIDVAALSGAAFDVSGQQLVYSQRTASGFELAIFDLITGTSQILLRGEQVLVAFDWHPNGQTILYYAGAPEPGLYTLDLASQNTQRLNIPFLLGYGIEPSWDESGSWVVSVGVLPQPGVLTAASADAAPATLPLCWEKLDLWLSDPTCRYQGVGVYLQDANTGQVQLVAGNANDPQWQPADATEGASAGLSLTLWGGQQRAAGWLQLPNGELRQLAQPARQWFARAQPDPAAATVPWPSPSQPAILATGWLHVPYYGSKRITAYMDHDAPNYTRNDHIELYTGALAQTNDCSAGQRRAWTLSSGACIWYEGHAGLDLGLSYEPVLAAAAGTVKQAGWWNINNRASGLGLFIELDHGNGYSTFYGHLSAITIPNVAKGGGAVAALAQIGTSGNSGNSSGPHLHFEVRRSNVVVDAFGGSGEPMLWADGSWSGSSWVGQASPTYGNWQVQDQDHPEFLKGQFDNGNAIICPPGDCPYWWAVATPGLGQNDNMLYTLTSGNDLDYWAMWRPPTGHYEVQVFIPRKNATTWWARYWLVNAETFSTDQYLVVDQYGVSDRWISLGVYDFGDFPAPWRHLLIGDDTTEARDEHCLASENQHLCQIGVDAARFRLVSSGATTSATATVAPVPPTETPVPTVPVLGYQVWLPFVQQ